MLTVQKNVDLYAHNTLRVRSTAHNFVMARSRDELVEAVERAYGENISLLVIGGGSNIVLTSKAFAGLVVRNLYMDTKKVKETGSYVDLQVSSGYPVSRLIHDTVEMGLAGVEYHQGLPGTVGGALYMNSKWTHPEIYFGDNVISATLLTTSGKMKNVTRDYFKFAYDYSILHDTKEIVLEAVFRFKKSDPKILKKRATEALAYRNKTQPHGVSSSGCFFQNISPNEKLKARVHTLSAGNLLDKSGMKGAQEGNFIVSPQHANFVINQGEGNPNDIKKLMNRMKKAVKVKFGITLKEEVVVI